ncbi:PGAP1-like alpha/beta domain-containing protein [Acanthopleuribacter pedis]|uniref:GPI inositol-deacylase PGAP1-like alpha/beta domain-containing protein n=1 Tax=Acanthopleuribacter pedis TaxID=442870 RepID=A0A8J7QRI6_9BACT|nr:hypothetical protein [Acanthopleuribacter pedis]MBO1322943.1 hypothetical protein [Acanthopleuribacter pedis]
MEKAKATDHHQPAHALQGVGRLTVDAVHGITDLVEALHLAINHLAAVRGAPDRTHTRGITGLVYRQIRAVTSLVGWGVDPLLAQLARALDQQAPYASQRDTLTAVLNGVIGDHLAAQNNPLAIPMQLRRDGQAVSGESLAQALSNEQPRLLILIHGLCMNDLKWRRGDHDHGAALARDLGFTPVYLRYNTGRHVSENGRALATLLDATVTELEARLKKPVPCYVLAHSMGGLVSRSACFYGAATGHAWPHRLRALVCLGTPHQGSMWEKTGNLVDTLLDGHPYSAPFSRLGKIRSCGITDLRFGNVVDADWQNRDRFAMAANPRTPTPLPEGTACFALAGSQTTTQEGPVTDWLGDGLVSVDSALGRHNNPALALAFPEDRQWVARGVNHLALHDKPGVYDVIHGWLRSVG